MHRKLFKSPKVNYFLEKDGYDRNKDVIERNHAQQMNERRFQYYNEIKERENRKRAVNAMKNTKASSHENLKPPNYLQ